MLVNYPCEFLAAVMMREMTLLSPKFILLCILCYLNNGFHKNSDELLLRISMMILESMAFLCQLSLAIVLYNLFICIVWHQIHPLLVEECVQGDIADP